MCVWLRPGAKGENDKRALPTTRTCLIHLSQRGGCSQANSLPPWLHPHSVPVTIPAQCLARAEPAAGTE